MTLQDAIQAAISCNPDLRAAEQRTQLADAILARARSEFYPRLGISEDFSATNNAAQAFMYLLEQGRFSPGIDFNNPGVVDDFHTQLLVQQGVYAGGRRVAETRAAAANRQAACFELAAVQNELVFRVAEAYYRVFQARELTAIRAGRRAGRATFGDRPCPPTSGRRGDVGCVDGASAPGGSAGSASSRPVISMIWPGRCWRMSAGLGSSSASCPGNFRPRPGRYMSSRWKRLWPRPNRSGRRWGR